MTVEKRDGRIVQFDESKIKRAIKYAASASKVEIADDLYDKLVKFVIQKVSRLDEPIKIDSIHLAVEDSLMKYNLFDVMRTYRDYRLERDKKRFLQLKVVKEMEAKYNCSHNEHQNANIDENSYGGRIGEAQSAYAKEFALDFMMSEKFAKNHKSFEGYIHDLDKYKVGMHNCLSIPFDDLLANPVTIKAKNDIRPAGSISTAGQLIVVYFQTQSMDQFGGVSATHLDWTFVPYVKKSFFKYYKKHYKRLTGKALPADFDNTMSINDKRYRELNKHAYKWSMEDTISEANQTMESMLHNLNTLTSRSGNQLPFTSVNYGRCTLPEGRLITKALLSAWKKGIGVNGLTPIFPCGIFQVKKGVNDKPGTPNYDLYKEALSICPDRIYPNFANGDWSVQVKAFEKSQNIKKKVLDSLEGDLLEKVKALPDNIQETLGFHYKDSNFIMNEHEQPFEYFSTMGCRTANGFDINFDEEYFKELLTVTVKENKLPLNYLYSAIQKDGRGNIVPCTIVLPFVAMRAKRKAEKAGRPEYMVEYFMDMLEERISDAKDEMIERFKWICAQPASAAKFMYNNNTMKGYKPEEGTISALKHGTFAIGKLGLAEALYILIGEDQTTKKGLELAEKIEQLYMDKCNEYKENYKLNFGVYETPAENLAFTSMKAFIKKYGLIENVSALRNEETGELEKKIFFTNSVHVPVWKEVSVFDKIDFESKLVPYSSAGSITYIEIGDDVRNNLEALDQFVQYAMSHDVSYFAMNFEINECVDCGSTDIDSENRICRKCGSTFINWLRRITGYLNGNYEVSFNDGKKQEVGFRKKHTSLKNIKIKQPLFVIPHSKAEQELNLENNLAEIGCI